MSFFYNLTKIIIIFVFPQALSRAVPTNRGDWTLVNGDEEVNEAEETAAENTRVASIPSTLKATIKFGYEDGMVAALNGEDFDTYIAGVMTHTQAHYLSWLIFDGRIRIRVNSIRIRISALFQYVNYIDFYIERKN